MLSDRSDCVHFYYKTVGFPRIAVLQRPERLTRFGEPVQSFRRRVVKLRDIGQVLGFRMCDDPLVVFFGGWLADD